MNTGVPNFPRPQDIPAGRYADDWRRWLDAAPANFHGLPEQALYVIVADKARGYLAALDDIVTAGVTVKTIDGVVHSYAELVRAEANLQKALQTSPPLSGFRP